MSTILINNQWHFFDGAKTLCDLDVPRGATIKPNSLDTDCKDCEKESETRLELSKDKEEAVNNFLKELSELTKRYGIEIAGCGCHGSPYLITSTDGQRYIIDSNLENLEWSDE